MKTRIASFLGLLLAGSLAAQASVITFDSQAAFDDHFTKNNGTFVYNSGRDGLVFATTQTSLFHLGNSSYNPGAFQTETISTTFSTTGFSTLPSIGLTLRAGDQTISSDITGLSALVNIDNAGQVRLRIASNAVYTITTFDYARTFTGLSLSTSTTFNFSVEQRNVEVSGVEQASLRLILSNADTGAIYADSDWITHANFANFADPGKVGMRIYTNATANSTYAVHSFSPSQAIPEPSTYALLGGALLMGGLALRRQRSVRM